MQLVALFAFVAFAFVAQANAGSIYDSSIDRGAIADAMKAKLVAAKAKLNNLVDIASDKLKETIVKIQKKADEVISQLKDKAHVVADKVFVAAQKIIAEIEKLEDKYLPNHGTPKPKPDESAAVEAVPEPTESKVESQ